ncbi:response regulator transcription factor [Cohnella cellulosilytica]|uniref:Response regulator n=1 Tax=Cohnella cellulosilytica TaxID=986710 RepID=A0ABW2F7I1_9BACL
MIKAIFADDEILTLEMLELVIDWRKLGIEIAGKAANGLDAMELIERENPDLVLTDILMPHMDGIELIRRLSRSHPHIKVIILSAYGEFQYAQEAIRCGAIGYLVKPIDELELEELIKHSVLGSQKVETSGGISHDNSNELVRNAKAYIHDNFNRQISLDAISNHVLMSKNYLSSLFKRETGINLWDYVTLVRIEHAKKLLSSSRMKNYEISARIGYENPSYFTKMFKKATGMLPQEYQNSVKEKGES